jgi:hypothetical protein
MTCELRSVTKAQECPLDLSRPDCGKICRLVCETKKLTAIGFGNECKTICIPGPSRPGCKHCAVCCGECKGDPCASCQESAPKCEFCWRDWFAYGCAQPRTVKVLTKWQAEKRICWYNWEVVDASCCDCVGQTGNAAPDNLGIAQSPRSHSFFKPAPDDARIGDQLPVSEEEWIKLAAAMTPDPQEAATQLAAETPTTEATEAKPDGNPIQLQSSLKKPSFAERVEHLFRK